MTDVVTTILISMVAGFFWRAAGGFIYWFWPPRPSGTIQFAQRLVVGFVAAALAYAIYGVTPFDASGAWDPAGVGKLIGAGFAGLAGLSSFLPRSLNESIRLKMPPIQ